MSNPLRKPEGLSWDAAAVELPEVPFLPPGQDAMSATIASVLPTLAAPLAANVAALSAKEKMFSGKLGVAQTAYQNSDDSGQQSIGQLTGMLGPVGQQAGQLGQSVGSPAQALGGQTGMFGSLMQQAMQAAQGGGGGQSAGGQAAGGRAGSAAARQLAGRQRAVQAAHQGLPAKVQPAWAVIRSSHATTPSAPTRIKRARPRNPSTTNARPCSAPTQMTARWPDLPDQRTAGMARARFR